MSSLVAIAGPRAGSRFQLEADLVVGRSRACDVSLPDDAQVSRRHARLVCTPDGVRVTDLGSSNGTFVDGQRITEETTLASGGRVQVGESVFVLDLPVRTSISEDAAEVLRAGPVEEFLPAIGESAMVFRAASALLACSSEAAALRCGAREVLRLFRAETAAAFLSGEQGLAGASVCGAADVSVPRALVRAASKGRAARTAHAAAAPLWAGGASFGVLFFERREEPIGDPELALLGMVARMCGEAITAARARMPQPAEGAIIGTSRVLRRALEQVRRVAVGRAPALLCGERSTGKTMLAHYLHSRSDRALGPYVCVDCLGPEPLLEEQLFGRPAGAGAAARLPAFTRADGGTLVLAAIDALPRELGVRVARALRDPASTGGTSDFRLVVTCALPPAQLAAEGRLDPELAEAIAGEEVLVSPLRERKADIPMLFEYFSAQSARALGERPPQLSAEARQALVEHAWTGNLRELRWVAERLSLVCPGEEILVVHLPRELTGGLSRKPQLLAEQMAHVERNAVAQALHRARGKKIQAAAALGISRPTLDKKILEYGLKVK